MPKAELSHIWDREKNDWYVENRWIFRRLLEEEDFEGSILDPFCGSGRCVESARRMGYTAFGSDVVDRGFAGVRIKDFRSYRHIKSNVVTNPPFALVREVIEQTMHKMIADKAAFVFPTRRLAAAHWLERLPLQTIWFLTPRPSMPPGEIALALEAKGKEASGGKQDFCVLVFNRQCVAATTTGWLHRDGGTGSASREAGTIDSKLRGNSARTERRPDS